MKKGFVVSAVLYPILIITLTLILSIVAMTDNRRKILDNMKLEVSEENAINPEMTNSELYHRLQALEEVVAELKANTSEDRFEEIEYKLTQQKSDYEKKISDAKAAAKKEANIYIDNKYESK